jgi:hypothetical protein
LEDIREEIKKKMELLLRTMNMEDIKNFIKTNMKSIESGIKDLKIIIKEENTQVKENDLKMKIQEMKDEETKQFQKISDEANLNRDKITEQLRNHTLGIRAADIWMYNQNTQLLYTAINNISEMKKNAEINLEDIGPIVGKIIDKQNNNLMMTMIISLENQKNWWDVAALITSSWATCLLMDRG